MKLDSITKMIKKTKNIFIFTAKNGTQWISNSYCTVLIIGLPVLNRDNIYTILSIEKSDDEKYYYSECDHFPLSGDDMSPDEDVCERIEPNIVYTGRELTLLNTRFGIAAVRSKYISYFGDLEMINFVLRDGHIAVMDGMLLQGYIEPVKLDDALIDNIGVIFKGMKIARYSGFNVEMKDNEQLELED